MVTLHHFISCIHGNTASSLPFCQCNIIDLQLLMCYYYECVLLFCVSSCSVCPPVRCVLLFGVSSCSVCPPVRCVLLFGVSSCSVCPPVRCVLLFCVSSCSVCPPPQTATALEKAVQKEKVKALLYAAILFYLGVDCML